MAQHQANKKSSYRLRKDGIAMKKLKNHAVLVALIAAIAVIGIMSGSINAKKDQGTFYLKDLQGSRQAIEDAVIGGELKDGSHRTSFRIEKGQVKTSTVLFEQTQQQTPKRFIPGNAKIMNGIEYDISNTGPLFEIVARDRRNTIPIPIGTATVNPPVHYNRADQKDNSVTYTNALEYGLAKIGDNVYFTLPTTTHYIGENGIYELKFSDNWGYRGITGDTGLKPRTVATFSLDKNKDNPNSSIEILGLEAVGSSLALIAVEDNQLITRAYDSISGKQLGETIVPHFYLAGRDRASSFNNPSGDTYYENYEAFSDHDQNTLNLSFSRSSSAEDAVANNNKTMFSFHLSSEMKLNETIKESFADGEEDNFSGMLAMSYRNDKLYVVKTMRSKPKDESQLQYDIVLPKRFMIYVYQASTLLYKGELMTDLNDDNIRAMNLSPLPGGFGYSQSEYRYYDNLKIE